MNVVVCVNHVPDSAAKINVAPDGKSIDKTGVAFVLNPYDEFAIEEALRIKEKHGGEVIAVSLGGDSHKETLRKALAMGVDKAVLLKDESTRDSFGVATALAEYIKDVAPDVILCGKQSIDADNAAVGVMIAELLGIPSVSVVVSMKLEGAQAIVEREIEGGRETVEVTLPALFTAQKGLNEPRYPALKGIMAAKSKPIEERIPSQVAQKVEVVAIRRPPSKGTGKIVGTDVSAVPELVRLLHEEAKIL
ncbi:MAG: electron transfer flavoprotein subunit beta/FixA family protein [Bacteroidetes bacterium]|nr:electron transfer flavoprotein subunit beta/FixA family protein [Bacteroidota bacterium]